MKEIVEDPSLYIVLNQSQVLSMKVRKTQEGGVELCSQKLFCSLR